MNKAISCLFACAALGLITACANHQPAPSHDRYHAHSRTVGDPFRLGMRAGYGPNDPASPAPPTGYTMWVDVADWQAFLHAHGYAATNPPDDVFHLTDENATIKFQKWAIQNGSPKITPNGTVDILTYSAAENDGMPQYNTGPWSLHFRHPHHKPAPTATPKAT